MTDTLEHIFAAERSRLFGLAYRMLGSASDAEDILQEAFLRASSVPLGEIRSKEALLTTVVVRLCIDAKRSARARRETYVGQWLPEPLATPTSDPVERAELISQAFLVVLESLSPLARAAFLLREVLGQSYEEIASVLDRDERACRQLVSRAKREVAERRPRFAATRDDHLRLVEGFASAVVAGDLDGLTRLFASEVTAIADGGGMLGVARVPVVGSERVARYFARLVAGTGLRFRIGDVNGWPALLGERDGQLFAVMQVETDGQRITRIFTTVNPEKLGGVRGAYEGAQHQVDAARSLP